MPTTVTNPVLPLLPRDRNFWIALALIWGLWVWKLDPGNYLFGALSGEHARVVYLYRAVVWLLYFAAGIVAVLTFRHWYFRKLGYEKRFLAALPLALLIALAAGMSLAFLVDLPVKIMAGAPFEWLGVTGQAITTGAIRVSLNSGTELSVLILLWILGYWAIAGALNARDLAITSLALENNLKEARLNALAGQINPHFLFNALNNIRFMVRKDAACAEESLVHLSEILRYSLDSARNAKVRLSQEREVVERYLGLMKNQMKDKLTYQLSVSATLDNLMIPPMIMQMLVENGIKHGVEQNQQGGRIDVTCWRENGWLQIEVRNTLASTGPTTVAPAGRDEVAHASIGNGSMHADIRDELQHSGKVGLRNIAERLALLYGASARVSSSQDDSDFIVNVEIPAEGTA